MARIDRIEELVTGLLVVAFILGFAATVGMVGGITTAVMSRQNARWRWIDGALGVLGAGCGFLAFQQAAEWLLPFLQSINIHIEPMRLNPEGPVGSAVFLAFLFPVAYRLALRTWDLGPRTDQEPSTKA